MFCQSYTMVSSLDKNFNKQQSIRKEFYEISNWQKSFEGYPLCRPGQLSEGPAPKPGEQPGPKFCVGATKKPKVGEANALNANLWILRQGAEENSQKLEDYVWNTNADVIIGEKLFFDGDEKKEAGDSMNPKKDENGKKGHYQNRRRQGEARVHLRQIRRQVEVGLPHLASYGSW